MLLLIIVMTKGVLTLVVGPMFAGKTTYLINQIKKLKTGRVLVVKPKIDTRYFKNKLVSHDRQTNAAVIVDQADHQALLSFYKDQPFEHLVIDEVNFWQPQIIWPQFAYLLSRKVNVWAAGTEYDFRLVDFGATKFLVGKADKVIRLFAVCEGCGGQADLSYRKFRSNKQVIVGGGDLYGACCRSCFAKLSQV